MKKTLKDKNKKGRPWYALRTRILWLNILQLSFKYRKYEIN